MADPSDAAQRLFRVDPRLVHATLMNAWVPALGTRQIIVADEDVVLDPRTRTILEMSAMETDLSFVREEDAHATVARLASKGSMIVLFSSLLGAERAISAGLEIDALNIGHLPEGPGSTAVVPAVHLGPADVSVIRRLKRRGIEVFIQPLPRDPKVLPPVDLMTRPTPLATPSAAPYQHAAKPRGESLGVPPNGKIDRIEAKLKVVNERGLHLRAAHALAHLAASMSCNVQIANGPDFVNAKSLLGLTTLGAGHGTMLDVVVTGPNASLAMEQIRALFACGFEEGVKGEEPSQKPEGER